MCTTESDVWIAFETGIIDIYSQVTHEKLFSFTPEDSLCCSIIVYDSVEEAVYVVFDTGRILVCVSDLAERITNPKFSPIRSRCTGSGKGILTMNVLIDDQQHSHLFCGHSEGKMSVWSLRDKSGAKTFRHEIKENIKLIASSSPDGIWTCLSSSKFVYRWDLHRRSISCSLDVGNITRDDSMITFLTAIDNYLYVALTNGKLLIVEKNTLRIISMIKTFGDYPIKSVLPLLPLKESEAIVVIGKGYSTILKEYLPKSFQLCSACTNSNEHFYFVSLLSNTWR